MLKTFFNSIFKLYALPACLIARLAGALSGSENAFLYFAQKFSRYGGKTGEYVRRAYYRGTLEDTGKDIVIGFGSFFTHRDATVGENAWIGQYTIIGRADIGQNTLISDHISILSGRHHHRHDENERLIEDQDDLSRISIGRNSWIGARSVVMSDVGEGSVVGAGSVVVKEVDPFSIVAGNPARLIRSRGE